MNKLDKKIVVTAAFLGAVTIGIGAFGAHGLKQLVEVEAVSTFETGVRYQMYHVIALLIISFARPVSEDTKKWVLRNVAVFWFDIPFSIERGPSLECKIFRAHYPIGRTLIYNRMASLGLWIFKVKIRIIQRNKRCISFSFFIFATQQKQSYGRQQPNYENDFA